MGKTSIEWTHYTFNPWWGCVEVSPACDNCYARTFAKRVGQNVWGKDESRRHFGPKYWMNPVGWNAKAEHEGERKRVFCGSMCDVMEDRADLQPSRAALYDLIERTPHLDWLLLTKRPQNFKRFLPAAWLKEPRPNVWLMTTLEHPDYMWRLDALRNTPAAIRGLSMEPLLGAFNFRDLRTLLIDWVIVGGESGPGSRPMHPEWVRGIRNQCKASQIAFHFKQWGQWEPLSTTDGMQELPFGNYDTATKAGFMNVGKKAAGRILDGRTWDEYPR